MQANRYRYFRGVHTVAASWAGAIRVDVWHDKENDCDRFAVSQETWQGSGVREVLAHGILGQRSLPADLDIVTAAAVLMQSADVREGAPHAP